ncbi:MAG: ShlB/FhaC/HecB family hemolysin secretion/activation protein [Candidatus Omnitrophota bacterium]
MNRVSFLRLLVCGVMIASCATPLLAATDPDPAESAGAEQARFDLEQEFRKRVLQMQVDEREKAAIEAPEKAEAVKEGQAFQLKGVTLTGNSRIPSEAFNVMIGKYVGKDVYMTDLRTLATDIKRHYREKGYIAAYVYLPPQTIVDGNVEIAVIEGALGAIEVTGNKWVSQRTIKRFLPFNPGQILFYDNLQKALSFINKHRDVRAKAILKPGKETGTTDLEIDVKDKFPVHPGVDVNNLGTPNTGKTRVGFSLTDTNLLGFMDQLSSRYQLGSRSWSVGADYNIPVHSSGTLLGVSYTRSNVDLGGDFESLNITGDATTYGIYAIQPIIRKSWVETSLNLGFDWKSVKNEMLGQKSGVDELRILNAGVSPEFTDRWGKTYFPNSFHFGFSGFLGASHKNDPGATRPGSGGQFFIYRSSLMRYNRLPWGMMYTFRGQTQLTNTPLAPSEQIRLGGAFAVRGYPEGEYLADYGAFMTNELLVPTYFFPKDWKLPYAQEPLREQVQGVTFFDFGGGALRKPMNGEKHSRTLAGTGLGVRIRLFDKIYARVQWATPTGSKASNGSESAFYYGVSAEFI